MFFVALELEARDDHLQRCRSLVRRVRHTDCAYAMYPTPEYRRSGSPDTHVPEWVDERHRALHGLRADERDRQAAAVAGRPVDTLRHEPGEVDEDMVSLRTWTPDTSKSHSAVCAFRAQPVPAADQVSARREARCLHRVELHRRLGGYAGRQEQDDADEPLPEWPSSETPHRDPISTLRGAGLKPILARVPIAVNRGIRGSAREELRDGVRCAVELRVRNEWLEAAEKEAQMLGLVGESKAGNLVAPLIDGLDRISDVSRGARRCRRGEEASVARARDRRTVDPRAGTGRCRAPSIGRPRLDTGRRRATERDSPRVGGAEGSDLRRERRRARRPGRRSDPALLEQSAEVRGLVEHVTHHRLVC